jgi:hypothetical protein
MGEDETMLEGLDYDPSGAILRRACAVLSNIALEKERLGRSDAGRHMALAHTKMEEVIHRLQDAYEAEATAPQPPRMGGAHVSRPAGTEPSQGKAASDGPTIFREREWPREAEPHG